MNFGFSNSRLKKKNQASVQEAWITVTLLTQILDICSFGGCFMRLFGRKRLFLMSIEGEILHFHLLNTEEVDKH